MQPGESIFGVKDSIRVFPAQVIFHILARKSGATTDHGIVEFLTLYLLDAILHLKRRLHQQPTQADGVGFVLGGGMNDDVARLLDAEIDYLVTVVRKDDVD